jgi:hypothetical protein
MVDLLGHYSSTVVQSGLAELAAWAGVARQGGAGEAS